MLNVRYIVAFCHVSEVIDDPVEVVQVAFVRLDEVDMLRHIEVVQREVDRAIHFNRLPNKRQLSNEDFRLTDL